MWEMIRANRRKSIVLVFLLASVLLILGYSIGYSIDPQAGGLFGLLIALGVWLIMMATSFAGGERILLATTGAREVTHAEAPQLFNIVEEMQIASGLPAPPRVYLIGSDVPNAFAVGLNPKRAAVAVTTGLLARLNRDELQGVIAHEIGHITNRDTLFMTLAGVTVGAVILLADLYLRGMRFSGRSRSSSSKGNQAAAIMMIVALILAILAPILAQLLYFACSRRREYLADASGAQFTRYPEGLASALEKITAYRGPRLEVSKAVAPMFIINPLAAAGEEKTSLFSTHPAAGDRIRVLRSMANGSSFAAYEEAFRAAHGNEHLIGARTLRLSSEQGIRNPSGEQATGTTDQWRAAQDLLHKVNQYAAIACTCGLKMKLPPGFDQKQIVCPRCGATHDVPVAGLAAASAALNAAANRPMRPLYPK